MSNGDPLHSRGPARRLVLRKIGTTSSTVPPPDVTPVATRVNPEPEVRERTPLPATRPTQSTYNSVPPVTATVITPLSTVLGAPAEPAPSRWKGVVGGAVIGLAIVGAFVVGARLSQTSARPTSVAGSVPPASTTLETPAATSPAPQDHPVDSLPVIAATALPLAPRPVRGNPASLAPRPAVPPTRVAVASADTPTPTTPVASATPTPTDAPPEDTAQSLVPVIPPSPPPQTDPFVKAIQTDIEEEQARRKRK